LIKEPGFQVSITKYYILMLK